MRGVMRLLGILLVVVLIFYGGFAIKYKMLQDDIAQLSETLENSRYKLNASRASANLSNERYESDKKYLDVVFNDIFTFYDLSEFEDCRRNALDYNFSSNFVVNFYNKDEFINNSYAEAMLDVMSEYKSCDLYLLDEYEDGVCCYMADIRLGMVKYNTDINMILFLELEPASSDTRIKSSVYYFRK